MLAIPTKGRDEPKGSPFAKEKPSPGARKSVISGLRPKATFGFPATLSRKQVCEARGEAAKQRIFEIKE